MKKRLSMLVVLSLMWPLLPSPVPQTVAAFAGWPGGRILRSGSQALAAEAVTAPVAAVSVPAPAAAESVPAPAPARVPPADPRVRTGDDYVLGKGDVLEVVVWRNEQLSRQVTVRPDGNISLPLLQDIPAAGSTVLEMRNRIGQLLSQYVESPKVAVIVSQVNSCKVSVLGRVVRPEVYPINGDTTLLEAISMAGGFTEWARKRKIEVIRSDGRTITVNYNKIVSGKDPSQNLVLQRGDTIIVP